MTLQSRREFASTVMPDGKTDVSSDGRTVWVNRGVCLARFCPVSHEYAAIGAEESSDGLSYSEITVPHLQQGPFLPQWEDFLAGVKNRWGIEIGPEHNPLYA